MKISLLSLRSIGLSALLLFILSPVITTADPASPAQPAGMQPGNNAMQMNKQRMAAQQQKPGAQQANSKKARAAKIARTKRADALFKQLNMKTGRIVMVFPDNVKQVGKPLQGIKGVNVATLDDLKTGKFRDGSRIAIFERDERGNYTSREALIVKHNNKLVVLDEGLQTGGKRRAKAGSRAVTMEGVDRQKMLAMRKKRQAAMQSSSTTPSMRESQSTPEVEQPAPTIEQQVIVSRQELEPVNPPPETANGEEILPYMQIVADATAAKEQQDSIILVSTFETESEATVGAWEPIVIEGETAPICTSSVDSSYMGSMFSKTTCKDPDEVSGIVAEPGQVWIGTAPFCDAYPDDCNEIGMSYVTSDDFGEGAKCSLGKKVLCEPLEEGETYSMWVGTAPFCNGSEKSCSNLGLRMIDENTCPIDAGKECCLSGTMVLCTNAPEVKEDGTVVKTQVWIGTAPFCKASKSDCADINMNFVKEDKSGDGKKCTSGTKVLCESK